MGGQCNILARLMLLTSLLGVMSGYTSLRGLADFMQRHQQAVGEYFGLTKKELPKYSTIRRMVHKVSGQAVAQVFNRWAVQELGAGSAGGVAVDGKALGSTFSDGDGHQDFVNVVSACLQGARLGDWSNQLLTSVTVAK